MADADAAVKAEAEELARQAREGLAERLASRGLTPGYTEEHYRERLEFELVDHREDEISRATS